MYYLPSLSEKMKKRIFNISALLLVASFLFHMTCIPISARRNHQFHRDFRPGYTYDDWHFFSEYDLTPFSVEDDVWLSSYAAISATERSAAASSDITAETYVANEMQDSVWSNVYLQASYLRLDVVLDSGENYKKVVAARSSIDGGLCRLSVSDVGEFKEKDIIMHFGSLHMLYIGNPRYAADVPPLHVNTLLHWFMSKDYHPVY